MYIIEFCKGVYITKGEGDPPRTKKIENAQRFSDSNVAELRLREVVKQVKSYRIVKNMRIVWVDEVDNKIHK